MSRSGLLNFENEPIGLINDLNSFFLNLFGPTVSVIRDIRIEIVQRVPAIRDTRVCLVVLVYCQARATPNDQLRPNAATSVYCHVGLFIVNYMRVTCGARSRLLDCRNVGPESSSSLSEPAFLQLPSLESRLNRDPAARQIPSPQIAVCRVSCLPTR
jgi:hypothetical protein